MCYPMLKLATVTLQKTSGSSSFWLFIFFLSFTLVFLVLGISLLLPIIRSLFDKSPPAMIIDKHTITWNWLSRKTINIVDLKKLSDASIETDNESNSKSINLKFTSGKKINIPLSNILVEPEFVLTVVNHYRTSSEIFSEPHPTSDEKGFTAFSIMTFMIFISMAIYTIHEFWNK